MKILHIAYFGRSGKLNGIYEAVTCLAEAQRKLGHEVKVAITTRQSVVDEETIYFTPKVDCLKRLLDSFHPDIVMFHSLYEIQQITFSAVLRRRRIPYVLVFHGGASKDNAKKGWIKKKIANWLLFDWFIHKAKAVIYLSENERQKSVFTRVNKNYFILPNGVNIPLEVHPHTMDGKMNITFLSRIDYYGKGIDVLLQAIRRLQAEGWGDRIQFNFYGNKYDDTYKLLLEYGDFVKYHGFVAGQEKTKALQQAAINILPSRSEGMPMTILEALAYGCPCMVTPMTNMAELIRENQCGWVIELTPESIVDAIKKAYAELSVNPNAYFENCRRVAQQFSWTNVAAESINIYQRIIKRNGTNS